MASGLHEERFPTATCLAIACSQTCMNPDLRDTSIFSANTIFVGHPGRIRAENENSKTLQSMATFQWQPNTPLPFSELASAALDWPFSCWFLRKKIEEKTFFFKCVLFADEDCITRASVFNTHNLHTWQNDKPHVVHHGHRQYRFSVNVLRYWGTIDSRQLPGRALSVAVPFNRYARGISERIATWTAWRCASPYSPSNVVPVRRSSGVFPPGCAVIPGQKFYKLNLMGQCHGLRGLQIRLLWTSISGAT